MGGYKGLKRCSFCDYSHKFTAQVRRHEQQAHGENARICTVPGCGQRVPYNRLARHIRQCHSDELKAIDTSSTTTSDGAVLAEEAQTDKLVVLEQRQKRMEQQREAEEKEAKQRDDGRREGDEEGGGQRTLDDDQSRDDENSPSSDVSSAAGPASSLSSLSSSVGVVPTAQLALGQHKCAMCGQRKATREALRRHIARVHEKRYTKQKREKRHHCEWEGCGKSFTTQGLLEDHVNGHTGNCPFSCDHCKRTFVARAYFVRHLRKYHAVSIRQMDRHIEQIVDLISE